MEPTATPVPSGFTEFMNHFDGVEGIFLLFGFLIFTIGVSFFTFFLAEGIAHHVVVPWFRNKRAKARQAKQTSSSGSHPPESFDDEKKLEAILKKVVIGGFFFLIMSLGLMAVFIGLSNQDGGGVVTSPTPTVTVSPERTPQPSATVPLGVTATPTPTSVPGEVVDISAVPFLKFDKQELVVTSGKEVTVRFDNRDNTGIPHNFAAYTDRSARTKIKVGAICSAPCRNTITFVASDPGTYFFRCDVHPIQMTGKLIVK